VKRFSAITFPLAYELPEYNSVSRKRSIMWLERAIPHLNRESLPGLLRQQVSRRLARPYLIRPRRLGQIAGGAYTQAVNRRMRPGRQARR
jgi:hypothetical protein